MKNNKNQKLFLKNPLLQTDAVIKPIGGVCNLECDYLFCTHKKEELLQQKDLRISDDVLETFIRQYIEAQNGRKITFHWFGSGLCFLGIDFFQKVLNLEKKYMPRYRVCENKFKTNGCFIDEEWCKFLSKNNFKLEICIDGPKELHNKYRKDEEGLGTFDRVMQAVKLIKKYKIAFNSLTCVNNTTVYYPLEVYRFLRDEVGADKIKFTPVVDFKNFSDTYFSYYNNASLIDENDERIDPEIPNSILKEWSVKPEEYGDFLITVFDEWYNNDLGKVFVSMFENAIQQWMGGQSFLCAFSDVCGKFLLVEHTGDTYCCDHLFDSKYKLGNIQNKKFINMLLSDKQKEFKNSKGNLLCNQCRKCKWLKACHGECLKRRIVKTKDNGIGVNYLCKGFKKYFEHIHPYISGIVKKIGYEVDIINPNWKE